MPHFYVSPENIHGNRFELTGDEVHHLADVRRYEVGDKLHLFDGTGKVYVGKIEHLSRERIDGVILEKSDLALAAAEVFLYSGVPKGDRFDWLVEKACELGVKSVIPLITERSVIKEISAAKHERWQRLALAASQQCGRPDILAVGPAVEIFPALASVKDLGLSIIPWEGEEARSLSETMRPGEKKRVNIFIGPEGGFTLEEIKHAKQQGVHPVTLGPRILRVETAGLLASVLVLNSVNEFARSGK